MLIGAMNHPGKDLLAELRWMSDFGLDFVDLTLEPPGAASWLIDTAAVREALKQYRLHAVGHTAFYLPIASPFEEVRRGVVTELARCIQVFAGLGVKLMNVHPGPPAPHHDRASCVRQNLRSLRELLAVADAAGVELMLENVPGVFNSPEEMGELLDPLPQVGLHLDIGHAFLRKRRPTVNAFLRAYGDRLRHVHLHDNNRESDLHLPLGAGGVAIKRSIRSLRRAGYDGTITLEVFSRNRRYLAASARILRRLWNQPDSTATSP